MSDDTNSVHHSNSDFTHTVVTQDSDIPSYHATKLNSAQVISNSKLKVTSLNCWSIRSQEKQASLGCLLHEHSPDIIVGCESHLDST